MSPADDFPRVVPSALKGPARAYGPPVCNGQIRAIPDDFTVDEILGFEPDGQGRHTLLSVRKTGANTNWVARRLARAAGVPIRDVGYCGLKDRHAVTTQWFSVPGSPQLDTEALRAEGVEVLRRVPHGRKLRRGAHAGNLFRLRVRGCHCSREALESRLSTIKCRGVPNYFGEQRFGRDGGNLHLARRLARGEVLDRRQRSFALSAARSLIFNEVLSRRVSSADWDRVLPGDVAILDGTASWFRISQLDREIEDRLERLDLHPSGPLWGEGEPPTAGKVLLLEQDVAAETGELAVCLTAAGLKQERRSLRLVVRDLQWDLEDTDLVLSFRLPRGAFATAVLAEIVSPVGPQPGQGADLSSR